MRRYSRRCLQLWRGAADPRAFFDANNNLKPVKDWTPEMAGRRVQF
jgi:hypothetical protein